MRRFQSSTYVPVEVVVVGQGSLIRKKKDRRGKDGALRYPRIFLSAVVWIPRLHKESSRKREIFESCKRELLWH